MKLWIIIGVPGSGKSTLANKIANEDPEHPKIFEADMYFIDASGKFAWRGDLLGKAHAWCYNHVETELKEGRSVIVSNTSLKKRDRKAYIDLGKKYNAEIKVITCTGNFKNIHGVPEDKIQKMRDSFCPFDESELE